MCPHCRAFIDPKARVCPYCENEVAAPAWKRAEPATALRGLIPQANFTTLIILTLNIGVFIASVILSMKRGDGSGFLDVSGEVLHAFGGKDRYFTILRGQWWRLVTAGFLHAGLFHVLMNSWVLSSLGPHAEEVFGTARFLVIYVVSSVMGFLASLFWSPSLSIGASAACCGLIGAMMAHGRRSGSRMIWSFYLQWIIMIAVIGLLPLFNVDNAAHFGGFAAGFALGYLAGTPRIARPIETVWNVAAGASMATVAVSFLLAYQWLSRGLNL
jgi:rhomboid protease GluP